MSSDDDLPSLLDSSSDLPSLLDSSSSDYDSSFSDESADEPQQQNTGMAGSTTNSAGNGFFEDLLERALMHLMQTGDGSKIAQLQSQYHADESFRDAFQQVFSSSMLNKSYDDDISSEEKDTDNTAVLERDRKKQQQEAARKQLEVLKATAKKEKAELEAANEKQRLDSEEARAVRQKEREERRIQKKERAERKRLAAKKNEPEVASIKPVVDAAFCKPKTQEERDAEEEAKLSSVCGKAHCKDEKVWISGPRWEAHCTTGHTTIFHGHCFDDRSDYKKDYKSCSTPDCSGYVKTAVRFRLEREKMVEYEVTYNHRVSTEKKKSGKKKKASATTTEEAMKKLSITPTATKSRDVSPARGSAEPPPPVAGTLQARVFNLDDIEVKPSAAQVNVPPAVEFKAPIEMGEKEKLEAEMRSLFQHKPREIPEFYQAESLSASRPAPIMQSRQVVKAPAPAPVAVKEEINIRNLPKAARKNLRRRYRKNVLNSTNSRRKYDNECPICCEELKDPEVEFADMLLCPSCHGSFHGECLVKWEKAKPVVVYGVSNCKCPKCNTLFPIANAINVDDIYSGKVQQVIRSKLVASIDKSKWTCPSCTTTVNTDVDLYAKFLQGDLTEAVEKKCSGCNANVWISHDGPQ